MNAKSFISFIFEICNHICITHLQDTLMLYKKGLLKNITCSWSPKEQSSFLKEETAFKHFAQYLLAYNSCKYKPPKNYYIFNKTDPQIHLINHCSDTECSLMWFC